MKQQIEELYIKALNDDCPPNVFANQIMQLFDKPFRYNYDDNDVIIPYLKCEYDLQIPKMKKIGINTEGQIFEQMINTVINMAEQNTNK